MESTISRRGRLPLVLAAGLVGFLTLILVACTTEVEVTREVEIVVTPTPVAFEPGALFGGPRTVSASGNGALWVLPGPRRLDPKVFGTPQQPLGMEPGVGVPLENRMTNEDGTAWTTTKNPTPFGDKAAGIKGDFSLTAVDATSVDGDTTDDQVNFTANFTGPDGKEYTIKVDRVLNRGPFHTFLGGVGTNFVHHGRTGIGFKMMPQVFAYLGSGRTVRRWPSGGHEPVHPCHVD